MNFHFSEEQLLFRDAVRNFLRAEVTPQLIRGLWDSDCGRSAELWARLVELGAVGMTVPEGHGGLGMNELDFVLLAEECGYVALPEPLVHTALVAVPLLVELGDTLAAEWLPRIAAGRAKVAVGLEALVEDADHADLLLLQRDEQLYAVSPAAATLRRNESVDPSRRLFAVDFERTADRVVCESAAAPGRALDRGALGCAAQALGLAQRMLDLAVAYTGERRQFGKPVGSFQAVKHLLADVALRLEYARAPVYRAAWSLANNHSDAARHVSHAKLAACDASALAARHSIQVHGAMGYTWDVDLHIYMKKAWAMAGAWGDTGFHKQRLAEALFDRQVPMGAGATFG